MSGKPKVKYVQLEPAEYPADVDWMTMDSAERGIYHSLIIYLLTNDGKLEFNIEKLCKICNAEKNIFELFWKKYAHKFQCKNKQIKHNRVSRVLRASRKLILQRILAGKASGKARSTSVPTPGQFLVQRNEKKRNVNVNEKKELLRNNVSVNNSATDTENNSSTITSSLRFADALERIIKPKDQSDRKSFINLTGWIAENILNNKFNEDIYARILQYAKDAKTGRKPVAVFFATLKREIGYRKQTLIERDITSERR